MLGAKWNNVICSWKRRYNLEIASNKMRPLIISWCEVRSALKIARNAQIPKREYYRAAKWRGKRKAYK